MTRSGMTSAALLLCVITNACKSWQVQPGPPRNDLQWAVADTIKAIRVVLASGETADVYEPRLTGDSIVGMSIPARKRIALALTDVRSVARYDIDSGKTALAIVGIALAFSLSWRSSRLSRWAMASLLTDDGA
jgi:hypothetical protein